MKRQQKPTPDHTARVALWRACARMKISGRFARALFLLLLCFSFVTQADFIKTNGLRFIRGNKNYAFVGANFWYGMNLGAQDKERLLRELNHLKAIGVSNLRILAATEGPDTEPYRIVPSAQPSPGVYNEELLKGLDFLLDEMAKRNLTAVVMLGNYWHWSGGFAQYLNWVGAGPIPYPHLDGDGGSRRLSSFWAWLKYFNYIRKFYSNNDAQELYFKFVRTIVTRTNTINGKKYSEDDTIMAWELANEPAGFRASKKYDKWIGKASSFIKSFDQNHLVTTGAVGSGFPFSGIKHIKNHSHPNIDYATVHIWVQNRGWYNPLKPEKTFPKAIHKLRKILAEHQEDAKVLNKPLVFEEFGIARDQNLFAPRTSVSYRDEFYREAFDLVIQSQNSSAPIAGVNFWAWAGEGVPQNHYWQAGDSFIGDPPHEAQGWYSIYGSDDSTIGIIRDVANQLNLNANTSPPALTLLF